MPPTNRVEHDSMGALEVPANALWGAQTQRAVQNFPSTGLRMPRAFIRAMGLIKHAAAGANAELGDLPPDLTAAIQAAALEVAADMTTLSIDELRRLLDPEALTEGGVHGAGSAA